MQTAQDPERKKGDFAPLLQESFIQLKTLIGIFNESMIEISKRYKCTVININKNTMRIERTKYKTDRKKKVARKSPVKDDVESDNSDESDSDETTAAAATNEIVPL